MATNLGMTLDDCVMLITPMFHGQCWGLPQAATLLADKIVLPGRYVAEDTKPLVDAMIAEGVTIANGAPAIFQPMLQYIETMQVKPDFSRMRMLSGASEPPLSMMIGFYDLTGAEVVHAYGATEATTLVTMNRLKSTLKKRLTEEEVEPQAQAGSGADRGGYSHPRCRRQGLAARRKVSGRDLRARPLDHGQIPRHA